MQNFKTTVGKLTKKYTELEERDKKDKNQRRGRFEIQDQKKKPALDWGWFMSKMKDGIKSKQHSVQFTDRLGTGERTSLVTSANQSNGSLDSLLKKVDARSKIDP